MDIPVLKKLLEATCRAMKPTEAQIEDTAVHYVNCHAFWVSVNRAAVAECKDSLLRVIHEDPVLVAQLRGRANYIEVGNLVGDQARALLLFAVGEVLGTWSVVNPQAMGMTGFHADRMARGGGVYVTNVRL